MNKKQSNMVSIHIWLTNRTVFTLTEEEVIYKDEHINTEHKLNLHAVRCEPRVNVWEIQLIVTSKMNKKSK